MNNYNKISSVIVIALFIAVIATLVATYLPDKKDVPNEASIIFTDADDLINDLPLGGIYIHCDLLRIVDHYPIEIVKENKTLISMKLEDVCK